MLQNFGTAFSVGLRGRAGPVTLEQPHIISLQMVHDMPWVGKYEKWRAAICIPAPLASNGSYSSYCIEQWRVQAKLRYPVVANELQEYEASIVGLQVNCQVHFVPADSRIDVHRRSKTPAWKSTLPPALTPCT